LCLCLVKRGSAGVRIRGAGDTEGADPDKGVIYLAGAGTSFTSSDDNERLSLWIPAAKLRECLETLIERPVTGEITFSPGIDMTRGTGASLRGLLSHLEAELSSPDSLLTNHIATDLFENLLYRSIIQGLAHNHWDWLQRPRPAADLRSVRRAETYIRAHLTEVVTLNDMAREAGCGVRSLQLAFQQARGTTPMVALRRARLEGARQVLECTEPDGSVTDVALRFGFSNPGRFANLYQRAFGETPSRTRRKRR
jgi:AraC-like DNA-binding protein